MYCPNCGANVPDSSKFCMSCGAKIEQIFQNQATAYAHAPALNGDDDLGLPKPINIPSATLSADYLIDLIEDRAFQYIQRLSEYHEYFHPCKDFNASEIRQFNKIREVYHHVEKRKELFLFYYDNTFTRNGKESFLLTEKGIHYLSERFRSGFISYADCHDMRVVTKNLFPNILINDNILLPMRFFTDGVYEFCDDMQNIVIPLLLNIC